MLRSIPFPLNLLVVAVILTWIQGVVVEFGSELGKTAPLDWKVGDTRHLDPRQYFPANDRFLSALFLNFLASGPQKTASLLLPTQILYPNNTFRLPKNKK